MNQRRNDNLAVDLSKSAPQRQRSEREARDDR
jgi:hypothetical protein